jgi:RimJ/RimL family protein N-acetyltransferase
MIAHGSGEGDGRRWVFETQRLRVRVAAEEDTAFFSELWKDPRVMSNVGFPKGLPITREEIAALLRQQRGRIFDTRLIAILRESGEPIGECKLGSENEQGVCTTDVKLLPRFWGQKFGVEIKQALVDYLFQHTGCEAIEATPNINNIASIRMQEAVGGVRVGGGIFPVPDSSKGERTPVPYHVYRVYRPQ